MIDRNYFLFRLYGPHFVEIHRFETGTPPFCRNSAVGLPFRQPEDNLNISNFYDQHILNILYT